jgi:hypothetical protein
MVKLAQEGGLDAYASNLDDAGILEDIEDQL